MKHRTLAQRLALWHELTAARIAIVEIARKTVAPDPDPCANMVAALLENENSREAARLALVLALEHHDRLQAEYRAS